PLVAAAGKLLVERLERHLLVLRLGELELELRELRLRVAHGVLRLPGDQARVAALGVAIAQAARNLLAQRVHAAAAVVPLPGEQQRKNAERQRKPARAPRRVANCGTMRSVVFHPGDRGRRSYFSKKGGHSRDGSCVPPPGDRDAPYAQLSGGL